MSTQMELAVRVALPRLTKGRHMPWVHDLPTECLYDWCQAPYSAGYLVGRRLGVPPWPEAEPRRQYRGLAC